MSRPSRRTLLFLAALLLVVGVVGIRALRTTTTEISRAEVVDRYERAVEDGEADDVDEAESTLGADDASGSDASSTSRRPPRRPAPAGRTRDDRRSPAGTWCLPGGVARGEQLDLATGAERTYPDEGFVTVTPSSRHRHPNRLVVERWQSLEFCGPKTSIELGTERIFHSFFGLDDLAVRSRTASPCRLMPRHGVVRARPPSPFVPSPPNVSCVVAGEEREVIVFTAELVEGDTPTMWNSSNCGWMLRRG